MVVMRNGERAMLRRASDYKTAQEVAVAVDLARCGATVALIERMTGFGRRWIRGIMRKYGGKLARKSTGPVTWFEEKPQRLLQACYVVLAYECEAEEHSPGRRLVDAYREYRVVARDPGILTINECAQIVDLYRKGSAFLLSCTACKTVHLALSERPLCPMCRMMEREFCKGCQCPLKNRGASLYCEACSPRWVRRSLQRKNKKPQASQFMSVPNEQPDQAARKLTPAPAARGGRSLQPVATPLPFALPVGFGDSTFGIRAQLE